MWLQGDMKLISYLVSALWRWQLQVCQEMLCHPNLQLTESARGFQEHLLYMFSPVSVYKQQACKGIPVIGVQISHDSPDR